MSGRRLVARRPHAILGGLFPAVLAAGCGWLGGGQPTVPQGTPIVLVSIDTLRSDHLPAYGYQNVATPAIDGLRRDSILYERAYSQVPLTLPSHTSLLTGLLPPAHGIRDNLGYRLDTSTVPYLPRRLKELGYATGAGVSAYVLRGTTGLAEGFDFYEDQIQIRTGEALGGLQRPGGETLDAISGWLDSVKDRPFFLFFHIYEPHSPYEPPPPYDTLYPSAYDGEVAAADAIIGRLTTRLKALGVYDRAVVILLSDHGEGLMDHGEQEHELLLYREVLQVPLLLKLPASEHKGQSVAEPVQLVDVFPTLMQLLGHAVPEGLAGHSLLAALGGGRPEEGVYSETFYPRLHFGWSELTSMVDGRFHYIEGPDPELYDVVADPGEKNNILRRERETYIRLRDQLAQVDRTLAAPGEDDPAARQKLAALGYVGSVGGTTGADGPLPDPKSRLGVLADLKDAFLLFSQRDFDGAIAGFRRVLAVEPNMVDAWEHLGKSLQGQRRYAEALDAFRKAFELSGGQPHVALSMAELLLQSNQLDEARKYAELALPVHEIAHDLLAEIALRTGDLAEAESQIAQAKLARGTRIGPLILEARLRLEQNRAQEAIDLTAQAEQEFGDRPDDGALRDLYVTRGKAYAQLGDVQRAEQAFLEGIQRTPSELTAYTHLAYLLAVAGRAADAGGVLQRMVQVNDSPAAYAAAVRALQAMGDPRSAAAVLQEARRRWPGSDDLRGLGG